MLLTNVESCDFNFDVKNSNLNSTTGHLSANRVHLKYVNDKTLTHTIHNNKYVAIYFNYKFPFKI